MKLSSLTIAVVLGFFLLNSCVEDPVLPEPDNCTFAQTSDASIAILPLGDSRVQGFSGEFESYRYDLWKSLIQAGWDVDFIGSKKDEGAYDPLDGICFDLDHEGTGGAVTTSILSTLDDVTFSSTPDVALVGIGGNDIADFNQDPPVVVENIRKIVRRLQALNADMIIFVEEIAPGRSDFMTASRTGTFNEFNSLIPPLAGELSTNTSKVVTINMYEGWNDSYMADLVHYNAAGAKLVADRYYAAMEMHVTR